jgi:gentisate 1,2-dioxygenase
MERPDYLDRLHQNHMLGLWEKDLGGGAQSRPASPYLWKDSVIRECLAGAAELIAIDEAEGRRVLQLIGPDCDSTTGLLQMSFQQIKRGETARAHRHLISAIRFVLRGKGAFSTVDGARFDLCAGDVLITPAMAWHDHGNDGDEDVTWIDVLDSAFVEYVKAVQFERFTAEEQEVTLPAELFTNRTTGLRSPATSPGSPVLFRWDDTWRHLQQLQALPGNRDHDVSLAYRHPALPTALTTIDCGVHLLRPGFEGADHRHTSASAYFVWDGEGTTVIDGHELRWQAGDAFVVPSWTEHRHLNGAAEPAVLFAVDERPLLERLGLYLEEPTTH